MQAIKNRIIGLILFYALLLLNPLIFSISTETFRYSHFLAFAADQDPQSIEIYSRDRPSIFNIQPKAHPNLGEFWENLKRSHLESIALFVEIYSNFDRYYLARDAELFFDLEQLLTKSDILTQGKSHLINVSRNTLRDKNIKNYLQQEGLSNATIASGKRIVLIDTGYKGTIPRMLRLYFPQNLRLKIFTHLLISGSSEYPSTRVFLTGIDPNAAKLNPSLMHDATIPYEHLAKFTHRSTEYRKINAKWEAVSIQTESSAGENNIVSPSDAQKYMEDLSFYASLPETQELFKQKRAIWRKAKELYQANNKTNLVKWLKEILDRSSSDPYIESLVRDFIEITNRSKGAFAQNKKKLTPITLVATDLGLEKIADTNPEIDFLVQLMNKYPQWAFIIENPNKLMKELVINENYNTLYQFISVVKAPKFYKALTKSINKAPATPKLHAFVESLMKRPDPDLTDYLTKNLTLKDKSLQKEKFGILAHLNMNSTSSLTAHSNEFEFHSDELDTLTDLNHLEADSQITLDPDFIMLDQDFDHGKHGVVSKVQRVSDGKIFALKKPKDSSIEHIESFRKEIKRSILWRELGLSDIEVFFYSDGKSLLKTFVEGRKIEEVLEDPAFWEEGSPARTALANKIIHAASLGYYVGDINRKNIKLTPQGEWKVIDSGAIFKVKDPEEALGLYKIKLYEKWAKNISSKTREKLARFLNNLNFNETSQTHLSSDQETFEPFEIARPTFENFSYKPSFDPIHLS